MKKFKLSKQNYEHHHYYDVLVTATNANNSWEDNKNGNAFCENKDMTAMVLNKYWKRSNHNEYEIVAYLSPNFFDRYEIADKESIYGKQMVVEQDAYNSAKDITTKNKDNKKNENKKDYVNHPPHYNNGGASGVECIDYIKQQLGANFPSYLEGSIIKYIHRHKYKDANIQDLKKAKWYLEKLIDYYENL